MRKKIKHDTSMKAFECWKNMIQRCENKSHPRYFQYGGRGIKVCKRWRNFNTFLKDMGLPKEGESLDRILNYKGYSPGNCRWATWDVQASNRGMNKFYILREKSVTLKRLAEITGRSTQSIWTSLNYYNMTPKEVIDRSRIMKSGGKLAKRPFNRNRYGRVKV